MAPPTRGVIARWKARLPVTDRTPIVSLLEGDTPLIPAPRVARDLGLPETSVYLKFEGLNPTGSFKDRGMTLAVSKALEDGTRGVLCASTGNTAASAAAYAARAGIRCLVLLPHKSVALGKLSQALIHGAEVLEVRGNFDAALALAREVAAESGFTVVNSINPFRLEGQKTAAFEVVEQLGRLPTHQFMPVGNAGNITAYWKGYREAAPQGRKLPRMMGFQAAGADPIVRGRPIENPKTIATAIRIGKPASWGGAVAARDESGGVIGRVSDAEILAAYRALARAEGVFCEPSSAAGVAGLTRLAKRGYFRQADKSELRIVCVLTGHGLKDPDSALKTKARWKVVPAELKAIRRAIGRNA
ncbi:MAG: threonine synthase [Proteobacteria bacterium]|nr:threonine synthase [Pseudomonadota bacterium]